MGVGKIDLVHKKSPVKVEGNLMFTQQDNLYCDLLHNKSKIEIETTKDIGKRISEISTTLELRNIQVISLVA